MKSINLIFNSGAMIFLLLVLDLAIAASNNQISHGGECNAYPEGDEFHQGCKAGTDLSCTNGRVSPDPGKPDSYGDAYTGANPAIPGTCTCRRASAMVWLDGTGMCVSQADYDAYASKKDHAATCTHDECKPHFKCHAGTAGNALTPDFPGDAVTGTATGKCLCVGDKKQYKDGKCEPVSETQVDHAQACNKAKGTTCKTGLECVTDGDVKTDETTPDTWGRKHDGASATDGKCACATSGHVFGADKMCKAKPLPPAPVDHGKQCGGTTKIPCKEPFKCHNKGKVESGKPDKQGTLVASTAMDDGKCVCEGEKKVKEGDKCGDFKTTDENKMDKTTDKNGGSESGSDRTVYQPISLQLCLAAAGSLLVLCHF